MAATATLLGLLIGASLGLLGGGGSILTVPIFVYVLGFEAKDAIAMSLAVVGATSLVGLAGHWRAGNVNVRAGAIFSAVAMAGTVAGAWLSTFFSGGVQLAIFAVVMLVAAAVMLRGGARVAPEQSPERGPGGTLALMAGSGLAVGVLTGVVGVGGGFLIVPALVLVTLPMREAVGTSLMVITANCAVGLYGYLGHVHVAWLAVALVTTGTIPGIVLGTYAHRFVPQPMLRRAFAALLLVVGAMILLQNAAAVLSAFGGIA